MSTMRTFLGLTVCTALLFLAVPFGSGCGDDCDVDIETEALPDGFVGESYFASLESDCGGDVWFLEQGNLPPGIVLQEDGDMQGTPTARGLYQFTVSVIDYDDDFDFDHDNDIAFAGLSIRVR